MAEEDEGSTNTESGAETPDEGTQKEAPPSIEDALSHARERLDATGTILAAAEGGDSKEGIKDGDTEGDGEGEKEEESGEGEGEEGLEEGEQSREGDDEGSEDEGSDEGDGDGAEEGDADGADEGDEGDADKDTAITVKVPSRHPDQDDIEIEVDSQELAERIAHLRSGFMRGEEVRARTVELDASEDTMQELSEAFEVDPAGFVVEYTDAKDLPAVVLALLTQKEVWSELESTIDKLLTSPGELRIVQAESTAARVTAKANLTERKDARKEEAENDRKLSNAIQLMVPEEMKDTRRDQLIRDLTRDTVDHITRNSLKSLDVKDLTTILAGRLETNGIDPLDARKAIQNGSRSRGKITTRKGPKKKPKTGQELARASAKRKQVAAAPGPGRKVAPAQPTKLRAGDTLEERLKVVREKGMAALLPES